MTGRSTLGMGFGVGAGIAVAQPPKKALIAARIQSFLTMWPFELERTAISFCKFRLSNNYNAASLKEMTIVALCDE